MNKKLLVLFVALMVVLPFVVGCTLRAPSGEALPMVPHAVEDVRFNNCVSCHAAELLRTEGTKKEHVYEKYTNSTCMDDGCHVRAD